ncbi:putative membrane protein [Bhargavaea ginsengi]|uniref:Putative membrane protein n=2 Tax=Bhargavaea ginsengi TaxID=426757 RepID=A0A1H6XS29_9BACL|nr:putative membrane protein [Bhargavaea ginsengi]
MMEWRNIYRGLMMGISDLIPGVSGGTIALILGIYDRLLLGISGFFSRDWKKHLLFLAPLGVGIGAALLLFSRLIDYLLTYHIVPTQFFFIGLVLGVLPFLTREAGMSRNFRAGHYVLLITVGVALAATAFLNPAESEPIRELNASNAIGLFFAGWLGSMAMLLPGISGSFILLLLGAYSTAIAALSDLNLPIIAVIGAGVGVGFIISSKVIHYLLNKIPIVMYSIIIGLIAGSVFVIFPGLPADFLTGTISLITFIAGLMSTAAIGRAGKKHEVH